MTYLSDVDKLDDDIGPLSRSGSAENDTLDPLKKVINLISNVDVEI